jgi:uncharacterized protein YejL (UPF0352 family)
MNTTLAKIPYPYISGAEQALISSSKHQILQGDDTVHQILTTLRSRLIKQVCNPTEALVVLDNMASQYGVLEVDLKVAAGVERKCGFSPTNLLT